MEYVIILTHTQIEYDSRIRRQLSTLSKNYKIILCCKKGNGDNLKFLPPNIEFFYYDEMVCYLGKRLLEVFIDKDYEKLRLLSEMNTKLKLNLNAYSAYEAYRVDFTTVYKKIYMYIKKNNINVSFIIANDVFVLPIANRIKFVASSINPTVKLLGDMHEIHFDYIGDEMDINQKIRTFLCDTYLPKCDIISSVSDQGAELYSKRYKRVPVVSIRNVAEYHEITSKITENKIRLIHVGNAQKARRIEEMIKAMELLDPRYTLDLYLVSNNEPTSQYINELKNFIEQIGMEERVRILEPVVSEQLVQTINGYDIGIFYIEPVIGNHKYILPNKLFEFIQGRVAVVTTPVYSMKEIIEQYEVGKVSKEYTLESFVKAIYEVTNNLEYYKENANKAAKILNTTKEWDVIMEYMKKK